MTEGEGSEFRGTAGCAETAAEIGPEVGADSCGIRSHSVYYRPYRRRGDMGDGRDCSKMVQDGRGDTGRCLQTVKSENIQQQ